jgi:hypothetical protein
MPEKNDLFSLVSYGVNCFVVALNGLFIWLAAVEPSTWGIVFGILFGAVTAAANVWAKRRMVAIAERTGNVNI